LGFTPSLELVTAVGGGTRIDVDGSLVAVVDDRQRSTVAGVFAAGEVTGVGGAALAVLEGELAASPSPTTPEPPTMPPDAATCSGPSPAPAPSRRRCTEPIPCPVTGRNG
jgi:hypothetical protein